MGRPSRRELLAGVGFMIPLVVPGCQSIDSTGSPTEPAPPPSTTQTASESTPPPTDSPCDALNGSSATPTATPCPDVEITYVSEEPRTRTQTAAETETTIPGAAGDNLVVRVRVSGNADRTLVGCIESANEEPQPISKTLQPRDEEYRLEFGPFSHHGIHKAVVWVDGCDDRDYWP